MILPRFILRWGLISALALGGATLLIGPERVAGGLSHLRAKAQSVVDHVIDDRDPAVADDSSKFAWNSVPHRIQSRCIWVDMSFGVREPDAQFARDLDRDERSLDQGAANDLWLVWR